MKKRLWILILLFIIPYICGGISLMLGLAAQNILILSIGGYSIAGVISFFVLFHIISDLFHLRIVEIKKDEKVWLTLHCIFTDSQIIMYSFFFFTSMIIGWIVGPAEIWGYFIISSSLSLFSLPFFYAVQNSLGMEYNEIEKSSALGIPAFAKLATKLFEEENAYGLRYLLIALQMLKATLRKKGLSLDTLDKAMTSVTALGQLGSKIVYAPLIDLSRGLSEPLFFTDVVEHLQSFTENKGLLWTRRFEHVKTSKWVWIEITSVIIASLAAVGAVLEAILPEQQKIQIVEQLTGAGTIFQIPLALALMGITVYFYYKINGVRVYHSDLKKVK